LVFEILSLIVSSLSLSPIETTTASLLLQYTSFFTLGGSNAISSIDLSSAYNGVSGYNVLAVGVLTFISNWSGPLLFVSSTNLELLKLRKTGGTGIWKRHVGLLTVFTTMGLLGVMMACMFLRQHLFIWTVFSPKFLYEMAWCLGMHLGGNVGFGGLLYWLGTKYI
jgi:ethanolaminephosphotransferase